MGKQENEYLSYMDEDEYRAYVTETVRRIAKIAEAEDHQMLAYTLKDGWAVLLDMETGKEVYSKA